MVFRLHEERGGGEGRHSGVLEHTHTQSRREIHLGTVVRLEQLNIRTLLLIQLDSDRSLSVTICEMLNGGGGSLLPVGRLWYS